MAVFTKLTKSQIATHLTKYSIGELLDFQEIIEGIDNSNFFLTTTSGKFVLTIFESRINKNELPFFINFKLHLAREGILCPRPILDNQGAAIVDLQEKKSIIVTFLEGKNLQPLADGYYNNITDNHCFEVGKTLAQLHLAAQGFTEFRKNDLGIKNWRPLFAKFQNLLPSYQKNLDAEILQMLDFLEKSWSVDLPSAAAHLDLFPDNVFFSQNQNWSQNQKPDEQESAPKISAIIDFYFAANDFLIYDFAIAVNAWCFDEKNNFVASKFKALKKGYEELRKFSPQEEDFLKIALCGSAMRFLLTRLHDMFFTPKNSLVKIKNPQEYLQKINYWKTKL